MNAANKYQRRGFLHSAGSPFAQGNKGSSFAEVVEIKECVRKGKYSNNRMPVEVECLLLECDIPKWYVESMKKIRYLFPKTHIIAELKRNICKYAVSERV